MLARRFPPCAACVTPSGSVTASVASVAAAAAAAGVALVLVVAVVVGVGVGFVSSPCGINRSLVVKL